MRVNDFSVQGAILYGRYCHSLCLLQIFIGNAIISTIFNEVLEFNGRF